MAIVQVAKAKYVRENHSAKKKETDPLFWLALIN